MPQDHTVTKAEGSFNTQVTTINENWLRVLDEHSARFLVLNLRSEGDMVKFFRSQPGWSVDFEDGESIIFARNEAGQVHDSRYQMLEGTS